MIDHLTYLNDKISISFTLTDDELNTYVPYTVEMKPAGVRDGNYKTIYNGSIYYTGQTVLQLNDIIATHMDDYNWFKQLSMPILNKSSSYVRGTIVDVRVTFTTTNSTSEHIIYNIVNGYLPHNLIRERSFDWYADDPFMKAVVSYGYNVTPRIPFTPVSTHTGVSDNFKFPAKFFINQWITNVAICVIHPGDIKATVMALNSVSNPAFGCNISPTNLTAIKSEGCYIAAESAGEIIKLADVDYKPSEYYLMWINRHGAIQCQPFCKKNTVSESISTSYINSMTDESIICNKTIEHNWTLNSHWLNYNEHNEFESLLTSKYIWLYDTNVYRYHLVNIADSKWTYKNPKNNKKPFNLTVNLKSAQQQNILY